MKQKVEDGNTTVFAFLHKTQTKQMLTLLFSDNFLEMSAVSKLILVSSIDFCKLQTGRNL